MSFGSASPRLSLVLALILSLPLPADDAKLTRAMSPGIRRLLARLCLAMVALVGSLSASAADILLTGVDDSASMQSFATALSHLRPNDNVRFQPLASLPAPSKLPAGTRLILLDLPSLDWRLQDAEGPATLAMRITRLQARQRLGDSIPANVCLLWNDPPPDRQLRLVRILLPDARRIGVLYDRHSEFLLKELRESARRQHFDIVFERWDNTHDSRPLQALLKSSDVLLGLDDPDLFNAKTAKNLLLSSYTRKTALIGPDAGFVKAGSLASSYSDQDDWLSMLDELLDRSPDTWPRTHYASRFKVLSNPQVARSLGIGQINDVLVATQLAERESHP